MTVICPECANGQMQPRTADEIFGYNGVKLTAKGIEYFHCPACGEDTVSYEQAKRNDVRFSDARRHHDRLLISSEIKSFRVRWSLTQQQASAAFGGGANAFSKYERGEVSQSKSMDLLIRCADKFEEVRAFLGEDAGVRFIEKGVHGSPPAQVEWHLSAVPKEQHAFSIDELNAIFNAFYSTSHRVSGSASSLKQDVAKGSKPAAQWTTERHGRYEYTH